MQTPRAIATLRELPLSRRILLAALAVLGLATVVSMAITAVRNEPEPVAAAAATTSSPAAQQPKASPTPSVHDEPRAIPWIKNAYYGASWTPHIKGVYWNREVFTADTDLVRDVDAREPAKLICQGLWAYLVEAKNVAVDEMPFIEVRSRDGKMLAQRGITELCRPWG